MLARSSGITPLGTGLSPTHARHDTRPQPSRFSAAGRMPRDLGRPGAYVGAVLRERRPIGEWRDRDEALGELDPSRGRRVEAIALLRLACARLPRRADCRCPTHDRTVGAHVVDVFVAIDIPDVGALAAREERRIRAGREQQRRLMPVDAAGNDFLRAFEQGFTLGRIDTASRSILACRSWRAE